MVRHHKSLVPHIRKGKGVSCNIVALNFSNITFNFSILSALRFMTHLIFIILQPYI